MCSGENRQARQVDPLPAPGRDRHLRRPQATRDRAGPRVEVPVQGRRVLGRVPAPMARVLEVRRPRGQPRPTLGAATPPRPTEAPQSGRAWEDQGRPTLEAADPPWEEVASSSLGRLEGVLLQSVEEASSNPNQATVVQAWWVPGWQVPGLEVLQEQELEVLPAPLAQGALVVLAVPVPVPDWEVQALDLAPAPVLAPTRALAPPALSETGDQPLDLPPPPPLLGAGAFSEPVWQEGFWEGLQVEPEEAWQAGSAMLSNLTGMGQTSISHSLSRRKALEVIFSAEKSLVQRPQATGPAMGPILLGAWGNGSRRRRGCLRKCSDSVLEPDSWVGPLSGWPAPWPATASTTSTRSSRGRCT